MQLSDNIRSNEHATAHAVHESTEIYGQGLEGTMAKAYSDYSFHGNGNDDQVVMRSFETNENAMARVYSSYSMDRQRASLNVYDDTQNRARSDLGLARPAGLPGFNPYGSGVVLQHRQSAVASSSPQVNLFSREDGMPVGAAVAPVHKREPRRVPSANDPYALYAQPDKITRKSVLQPAPPAPPPPPPPPNQQPISKSRDGFANTGNVTQMIQMIQLPYALLTKLVNIVH
jgi:hypothetical protein